jgi:hypothetical protein
MAVIFILHMMATLQQDQTVKFLISTVSFLWALATSQTLYSSCLVFSFSSGDYGEKTLHKKKNSVLPSRSVLA